MSRDLEICTQHFTYRETSETFCEKQTKKTNDRFQTTRELYCVTTRSYFSCHMMYTHLQPSWMAVVVTTTVGLLALHILYSLNNYIHTHCTICTYIIVMMYKVRVGSDTTAVRSLRVITTHDGTKDEKNICSL